MDSKPQSLLWFARDARGQVALVDSGRAGPTPRPAPLGFNAAEVCAALPILEGPPREDLRGRLEPSAAAQSRHVPQGWVGELGAVLVFSKDPDDKALLPNSVHAWECPSADGPALIVSGAQSADLKPLHSQGRCRACFLLRGGESELAQRGIYFYRHLCEAWITGPLGCAQQPASPLSFENLPPEWQVASINLASWIDDFGAWPRLQLLEFLPCLRQDGAELFEYLDVHGELQFPA